MTAYRDIDRLTELGILRRTRHGITAQPSSIFESSLEYRSHVFPREKEAISAACLELVEPGMSLIIDDGTTLIPLVERLGERVPLTVITLFVRVIGELSKVAGIDLIMVGGSYRRRYESLSGVLCADMISQLRADILFLSPSAVHQGTALHQDEDMVATKRAMIESSEQRVLVADHSKLGRRATHRLGHVSDFDVVITDDNADQSQLSHTSATTTPRLPWLLSNPYPATATSPVRAISALPAILRAEQTPAAPFSPPRFWRFRSAPPGRPRPRRP